ncbi:lipopolysaccharide biosynthesis protein [Pontibacter silvestris]|uniref:Lipopolysaccharide biosynthesis protein n=1 Tax=Pontibacter silvestris TaxID=2305183 RepID=A0ABW4X414_9BACT|nr:lipopolysaccharide biosynthesis protein [Pontibacter silvestris]MCC9135069.1 lipopolysaccharide biosynthesis protein [Pontibacter silvestris]
MSQNLTSKTVNGLKWSSAATATNSLMQIGYTAVMARLLDPAAFGLVALAGVVLRFAAYFAQMGMGQALIQKKELVKEDIRSAFTSSLLLGVIFLGLVWLLAPFATLIFDNKGVVPVVRVMAFSFLITGLSTTSVSLLRRNMQFKSIAIIEIIAYVVAYIGVGVSLGYLGYGVWSLVYASLTSAAIITVLSYLVVRHNVIFLFSWKHYKPFFEFGSKISFISFLEFLASNLDTIIIGRLLGPALLGIYNRAFMLISLPINYLANSISKVLFPAFSKLQGEVGKLKNIYLSTVSLVGFIIIPACAGVCVAADTIVHVLLGDDWLAAIPVLQILALSVPLSFLAHFGGILCDATGTLKHKIYLQMGTLALLPVLFYLLYGYGLPGIAFAILLTTVVKQLAYIIVTKYILHFSLKEALSMYIPGLFSAIITGVAIFIVEAPLHAIDAPKLLMLLIDIAIGAITLFLSLFLSPNNKLKKEIGNRLESAFPIGKEVTSFKDKIISRSIQILT